MDNETEEGTTAAPMQCILGVPLNMYDICTTLYTAPKTSKENLAQGPTFPGGRTPLYPNKGGPKMDRQSLLLLLVCMLLVTNVAFP